MTRRRLLWHVSRRCLDGDWQLVMQRLNWTRWPQNWKPSAPSQREGKWPSGLLSSFLQYWPTNCHFTGHLLPTSFLGFTILIINSCSWSPWHLLSKVLCRRQIMLNKAIKPGALTVDALGESAQNNPDPQGILASWTWTFLQRELLEIGGLQANTGRILFSPTISTQHLLNNC